MGKQTTFDEFMAKYNPDGSHPVTEVTTSGKSGASPFIVIRHEGFTVIVNPLGFDDHLSVDVHSFVDGQDAVAGVLAMTTGREWSLPETGRKSHGWNAAHLIAVLVGEQD